jgi:hypothetical protein
MRRTKWEIAKAIFALHAVPVVLVVLALLHHPIVWITIWGVVVVCVIWDIAYFRNL